ncbi:hypothetical protein F5Y13DRAFT_204938 [Hypoxylon sp. FL1857]|nr:hypothetical protein F5Y13DRAFT_204938 [Hypoxylon sp. FL1857]
MARTKYPLLHTLFHKGFHGGLRWETQARDVYDERMQRNTKKCRFLLHHPHSSHLVRAIVGGLKTARPVMVSLALADIYKFAAEKMSMCEELEPEDFFARAKNSFAWSASIRDQAFWAFTYKAFHARAIFINTMLRPTEDIPAGPPLVQALDNFRSKFLEMYPISHDEVLEERDSRCQENIERAEEEASINKRNGQGDGTDKLVGDREKIRKAWKKVAGSFAPKGEEIDLSKVPDEELFYYDTECKSKHRDAFKDSPSSRASGHKPLGERVLIRKYDAFKDYREVAEEEEDEEEDGEENQVKRDEEDDEDQTMGEAGEEDELPQVKKLKITD